MHWLVLPCLFSLRLPSFLAWFLSVFRVLVPRLLLLRLLSLPCCLSFLLRCEFQLVARGALTRLFAPSLGLLLLCWCSPLPLVALVLGVLPLPVVLLAACCLWLLVLVVCWWLCLLLPFLLLVSVRPGCFLVAVVGVRSVLPWVAVGGCCCGCPLVLVLPFGLGFPGLLLVLWVLLAAGGLAFLLPVWFLFLFFSWFVGLFLALR